MAARYPEVPQDTDLSEKVSAVPHDQEYRNAVAVACSGHGSGSLFCPCGVATDPETNQIYVTDGSGYGSRVSIFSETGEFFNAFKLRGMNCPWGLAIQRDNIYLTDTIGHFVIHFKLSKFLRFVARKGKRGSGIGEFHVPRQLIVSTNSDIFVTDCFNHRIQILDSNLCYQREISHQSMKQPTDVKLTTDEVYVLSDVDSPCLHVFSHAGYKTRSLITRGDIGVQVKEPLFFCLDPNGNMLISDCGAHKIKKFSIEGKLLHTLGELGQGVGEFTRPFGLALTQNIKLVVVSENAYYTLQIFSV